LAELRDLSAIGKDLELDLSEIPGLELEVVADSGEAEVESEPVSGLVSELATEESAVAEDITTAAEVADSDNIATLH
jgi:hypothetical protein